RHRLVFYCEAEDGIRDRNVTGVQTCALPIYGPFNAIVEATDKTWQLMKLTVSMLGKLITGDVKLNNLSGPISIAKGAGITARIGVIYYLPFLALICVNVELLTLFYESMIDITH